MFVETSFQRIYPENGRASEDRAHVKKLIFCSGKTYYDLVKEREKVKLQSEIAVVRIEQLSPFPLDLIRLELEKYPHAKICFAQEEPKNMGPVILRKNLTLKTDFLPFSIPSVNHV